MIHLVDDLLVQHLKTALTKEFGQAVEVAVGLPRESEGGKKLVLNLYLHWIEENLAMREYQMEAVRPPNSDEARRKRPPVTAELRYLVTASGETSQMEHKLLSAAWVHLLKTAGLRESDLPEDLILQEAKIGWTVAQPESHSAEWLGSLWASMGLPIRPSLSLVVQARFNPFDSDVVRVVRHLVMGLGQGTNGDPATRSISTRTNGVSAAGIVKVNGNGVPLAGVRVEIEGRPEQTMTDARGFFYFEDIPTGAATLKFTKLGFETGQAKVQIPPVNRSDLIDPVEVALVGLDDKSSAGQLLAGLWQEPNRLIRYEVTGRLRKEDGSPAAYVQVRAENSETVTNDEGFYVLAGLQSKDAQPEALLPGKGWVKVGDSEPASGKKR